MLKFGTDNTVFTRASASVDLLLFIVIATGPTMTLTVAIFLRLPSDPRLNVVTFGRLVG
jgi:hypothetical protein